MDDLAISSAHSHVTDCYQVRRIKAFAWYYTAAWTLLLVASAVLTVAGHRETITNLALSEARTAIRRDVLYRNWSYAHGGTYAPVTDKTVPNPYLSNVTERDINTPSGIQLTLISPAYMTRQVYEFANKNDLLAGTAHLTSLNPLRPENAPDPWEKTALSTFENGTGEVHEMVQVNGLPFMRLMQPLATESSCLECHLAQGYKVGDIRGGLSVTLPVQPLLDASRMQLYGSLATHGAIWILGLMINFLGARKLISNVVAQMQVESELNEQTLILKEEIADRKATQKSLQESEDRLQEQNYELQATEEMLRVQLGEYELSQSQLKESNANLQAIFEVSPLPIIISSYADGHIREVNQTFCTAFGYHHDNIIGKTGFDLGIWNDPLERNDFLRSITKKDSSGFPGEIKNSNGDVRNITMHGTTIDYNNEPCLLIEFMDITDQKRIENELRQAQKMDVVGQLAGGVAHDFNNMLTAIIGSAEMMERYVQDNPAQAKLLTAIREAAKRSAELTAQLMAFSRKGSTMPVQVWINKTIPSVINLLERTIDKKIQLETRLTADQDLVIGDPAQLQNALLNLGLNARDAMPHGGTITYSTATVFLDSAYCSLHGSNVKPGYYLEISVSDTGSGISKEIVEHIFEPFFTTKEIGKGTGLGLAAVYGTVREHQGNIEVYSELGIGTIFKIHLPLAKELQPVETSEKVSPEGSGGILLVDDEPLIREMGQTLLEDRGYQVFIAENGEQALEIYERERERISLVILDVVMPVMGGRETLERLITAYPDVNVLISSGFHQNENNDSLIKLGARGFIQKPYRSQELYKTVSDIISSTRHATGR